MVRFERDIDVGVFRPDRPRVAVGHVDAADRQADVVDHLTEIGRGMICWMRRSISSHNRAVSSIRVPVWARTCSLIWPRIDRRKEVLAKPWRQTERQQQQPP